MFRRKARSTRVKRLGMLLVIRNYCHGCGQDSPELLPCSSATVAQNQCPLDLFMSPPHSSAHYISLEASVTKQRLRHHGNTISYKWKKKVPKQDFSWMLRQKWLQKNYVILMLTMKKLKCSSTVVSGGLVLVVSVIHYLKILNKKKQKRVFPNMCIARTGH